MTESIAPKARESLSERTARAAREVLAGERKDPAQRNGLCHFPHGLGGPCLSRLDQRRAASVPDYAVLGCRRSPAQRNASPRNESMSRGSRENQRPTTKNESKAWDLAQL